MAERLHRIRWVVPAGLGLLVLSAETIQHRAELWPPAPLYLADILIFGILLPTIAGLVLGELAENLLVQEATERQGILRQRLQTELAHAQDHYEIQQILVRFPRRLARFNRIQLIVLDETTGWYDIVADYSPEQPASLSMAGTSWTDPACDCTRCPAGQELGLKTCRPILERQQTPWTCYCLPLRNGLSVVGLLHLYPAADEVLTDRQITLLESLESDMTLALESSRLKEALVERSEIAAIERRRLARDLHDTISQNLGYIRLRLDQFTRPGELQPADQKLKQELRHLKHVANDAFELVRGILTDLDEEEVPDLTLALKQFARTVSERANLEVRFQVRGGPQPLPPPLRRELLYIFRESLHNIEQHARAKLVEVEMTWSPYELQIRIRDDGQGFLPDEWQSNGHYGLRIINERVRDLRGEFRVNSELGAGTSLKIAIPLR